MTNSTTSRRPEEVIFERYWAHSCAQCQGLDFVETREPHGYVDTPVDTFLLTQIESLLHSGIPGKTFREGIQMQVVEMFGAFGRMPSTAEILERIPSLSDAIGEYVAGMGGGRQAYS